MPYGIEMTATEVRIKKSEGLNKHPHRKCQAVPRHVWMEHTKGNC